MPALKKLLWRARVLTPVVVIFIYGFGLDNGALIMPFQWAFLLLNLLIFNTALLFTSHRQNYRESFGIHRMVSVIFIYMSLSFLINTLWSVLDPDIQIHRLKSFLVSVHFLLFYYIGRFYSYDAESLHKFMKRLFWTFAIMVVYFAINGIKAYFALGGDLMALRGIVYHRYAMVFIFAAFLFIPLYAKTNSRTLRVAVVAMFIMSIFVGLASMTRAIIIQIVFSVAASIFLLKNKRRIVYYSVVALLFVIAILPLVWDDLSNGFQTILSDYQNTFGGYFVKTVYDRVQALINAPYNLGNEGSDSERFLFWKHAIELLVDNPLQFFMGFGELGTTYVGYEFTNLSGAAEAHYSSHSQIIDIVVRGGVIGLFLYTILFITIIWHGVKKAKVVRGFAGGLWKYFTIGFIGVLGYSVAHETLRFPYFSYFFWFILGAYSSPSLGEDSRGNV